MKRKVRARFTADEWDAFTPWRHVLCSYDREGRAKDVKAHYNRRLRRMARQALNEIDPADEYGDVLK